MRPRSFTRLISVLLTTVAGAVVSQPGAAQDTRFSDRGDRDEGVITTQEISGGYFSLSGVQIEAGPEDLVSATRLRVAFWLPESERPAIKVWLPAQNYWMVPHSQEFGAGEQSFSWPVATVLKPLGVDVTRLQVLIANEEQTLYFPAKLEADAKPAGEFNYVFSFVSRGGVYLKGSIVQMTGNGFVVAREFAAEEKPAGNVRFRWDGRDESGEMAPAGIYHLRLEGEIWLANRDDSLSIHVPFVHRGPASQ